MDGSHGASTLGDLLLALKERSGHSYDELARKTYTSRSALHRYCTGKSTPPDAAVVTRIAQACGASREELHRTLQAWLHASAEQRPDPPMAAPPAVAAPVAAVTAEPPGGAPADVRGARTRRSWAQLAISLALLAALTTIPASVAAPSRIADRVSTEPQWATGPSWVAAPSPVEPTTFGVTIGSDAGEMPAFRVGAVRFWDSNTRWAQIQPRRGEFDWTTLDRLVGGANDAGLPALFVIGGTPEWAAPDAPKAPYSDGSRAAAPDDLGDWDTFVRELVHRFKGRIEAYELWVMANDRRYFTGRIETLVEMTRRAGRIIKKLDPEALVVCPGMGQLWKKEGRRGLQSFAELGGYRYCDVAGIKLHQRRATEPPETMLEVLQQVDETMHRADVHPSLWSTGTTYSIVTEAPLDERQAIDHAMRFYLTGLYGREQNLRRMYFYSWGNTRIPVVLQAEASAPTRAALAVEELQRWLAHARIRACGHGLPLRLPPNVWQCDFRIDDPDGGHGALIRWTHTGTAVTDAPPGARAIRRIGGAVTPVRAGDDITVDRRPILIEYR